MDRNNAMQIVIVIMYAVALRKESVDRNIVVISSNTVARMSLSARRAWIEIQRIPQCYMHRPVALRKESVDRNFQPPRGMQVVPLSLSARRAWIEIGIIHACLAQPVKSLSARRAWIEIRRTAALIPALPGRSPQGERG